MKETKTFIKDKVDFKSELESLINKYSQEQYSNTPDFILADYLFMCLEAYNTTMQKRDKYYGVKQSSNEIEE